MPRNRLNYGDDLNVLRRKVARGSVNLSHFDPPFNSKRKYLQKGAGQITRTSQRKIAAVPVP